MSLSQSPASLSRHLSFSLSHDLYFSRMLGFKRGRREARGFGSMPWALSRGGREVWGFSGSKLQGWGSGVSVGGFRGLSQRGEIFRLALFILLIVCCWYGLEAPGLWVWVKETLTGKRKKRDWRDKETLPGKRKKRIEGTKKLYQKKSPKTHTSVVHLTRAN